MAHHAPAAWAPWGVLLNWAPFKIDALGLVTLLGAEEINAAVGRLVSSAYLEYLPLLGAYVIAGDRFTEKAAGWNLYNITQGIHTTDLAAWLTRWMLSQDFEMTRNFVVWEVTPPKSRKNEIAISFLIGLVLNGFLIAGTILSEDWYGLANALAMVVSIIVRVYVIGQQRLAVDDMVDKAVIKFNSPDAGTYEAQRYEYKSWKKAKKEKSKNKNATANAAAQDNNSNHSNSSSPANEAKQGTKEVKFARPPTKPDPKNYRRAAPWTGKATIKVLIIQSDSKAVTFWMPNEFLLPPSVFIEGPVVLNPNMYFVMRSIGWLAFAVHIVAIGMADLASQMYTVGLIVLPTVLLTQKTGCDDSDWMRTFRSWKKSIFHGRGKGNKEHSKDENAHPASFKKVRECWIGHRLKAKIYEWPENYDFHQEKDGDKKKWVGGGPPEGEERPKKRQDLYAWLALTRDEEESMDKWDLFPHIRKGNYSWWETYKQKKHALTTSRDAMGPQYVPPPQTGTQSSQDPYIKPFQKLGRTATDIWIKPSPQAPAETATQKPQPHHGGSVTGGSSAFPAISAHEEEKVDESKTDGPDTGTQLLEKITSTGSQHNDGVGALPRVDTHTRTTGSTHNDPGDITKSPTAIVATDEQP